ARRRSPVKTFALSEFSGFDPGCGTQSRHSQTRTIGRSSHPPRPVPRPGRLCDDAVRGFDPWGRLLRRREFITLVGSAAAAWPLAAQAQQPAMALVGLLSGSQLDNRQIGALGQGLKEIGYIEGRSVAIKYRSADGRFDRLPELAAELVADPAAVIVTNAPSAALVAKAATATIPIVFTMGADPIDLGLVSSLNRPGGNVTGVNFLVKTLTAKRLELLRELMPSATVIGFLTNL